MPRGRASTRPSHRPCALRNSVVAELLLLVFVYAVGIPFVWRDQVALDVNSWYATAADGRLHPFARGLVGGARAPCLCSSSCACAGTSGCSSGRASCGRFRAYPSSSSRCIPTARPASHFLALSERAYRPVLLGLGTVLAGMMANRIFYAGAKLVDFKVEIVGTVALLTFAVLGPLLFFWQPTPRARGAGESSTSERWGSVMRASSTTSGWAAGPPPEEPLLGSADIQSLADLRNSYLVVDGLHVVPFSTRNIMALAIAVLAPVAPLLLTTFSVEELVDRLLRVLF